MGLDGKKFISHLTMIFERNGLNGLTAESAEKFLSLTSIMLCENEKYNLTAITDPQKIVLNHYADCATLAARLPIGALVADVGCGAGFPTLPLAILRPDLRIFGIDSTAKRTGYVAYAASELKLHNVQVITARAEDIGKSKEYRESFNVVTARAVATMRVLCELCLPLVKVGGSFIAMKGKNAATELEESKKAISTLGGDLKKCEEITLSSDDEVISHPLIFIEKKKATAGIYPRAYAKVLKQPL